MNASGRTEDSRCLWSRKGTMERDGDGSPRDLTSKRMVEVNSHEQCTTNAKRIDGMGRSHSRPLVRTASSPPQAAADPLSAPPGRNQRVYRSISEDLAAQGFVALSFDAWQHG